MLNNLQTSLTSNNNQSLVFYPNKIIFKKYKIIKPISDGTFGQIYLVLDKDNNPFAMKTEIKAKNSLLKQEAYILLESKSEGFPEIITFGSINNYYILIEQYLGQSLNDLLVYYKEDNLSFQDKCLISIQLIERIKFLHSKTLIHRDIKPHNFLIGDKDKNIIYLTEFRFCTKFRSSKTGKHISPGFKGTFTGTLRFSSANAQKGMQQSRRDDMESIGYVILNLFKGKLPWDFENFEDIALNEKEIYLKTYRMKKFMSTGKLCKGCPDELNEYFKIIRGLKFEEEPDYELLRNLFIKALNKNNPIMIPLENMKFSWEEDDKINDKNNNRVNSRSKSKKRRGRYKLYQKILKNYENQRSNPGNTEKNFQENNNRKLENYVDDMKKSFEINKNYKYYSNIDENQQNNYINKTNYIQLNNQINNNIGNNLNMNNYKINKIDNRHIGKQMTFKNNLKIKKENLNSNSIIKKQTALNKEMLYSKEKNLINQSDNNFNLTPYYKINNNVKPKNTKININNKINSPNINININNNNNINLSNHLEQKHNQSFKNSNNKSPILNHFNTMIYREKNLNSKKRENKPRIDTENNNKYKLLNNNNQPNYLKMNKASNQNNQYMKNINMIHKNSNSNKNNLLNIIQPYFQNKTSNFLSTK